MAHTLASLEKSDFARLVMDYQNKFDTVLNNKTLNYWIWRINSLNLSHIWKFPEIFVIN